MKKRLSLILLIGVVMVLFLGCKTCPHKSCPSTDVVVGIMTPLGQIDGILHKGHLDEINKGKSWLPLEEYNKLIDE